MPAPLRVRELTDAERLAIERLARSRTAATRLTERACIIWYSSRGELVDAIAERVGTCAHTVRRWITRFNTSGVAGLDAAARRGRPTTDSPAEVAEVVALALTNPQTLDLPFASWTLDRLAAYLNDVQGIAIQRSRMSELLVAEGLRWRTQETWFGARVAPEFVEKRGASQRSTRRRRGTSPCRLRISQRVERAGQGHWGWRVVRSANRVLAPQAG
jgi:transposase